MPTILTALRFAAMSIASLSPLASRILAPGGSDTHRIPDAAVRAPNCQPASGDATSIITRMTTAAGVPAIGGGIRYEYRDDISQNFQSDRMYPPYLTMQWGGTMLVNPATRVQRIDQQIFGLGNSMRLPVTLLHGERATYSLRDTALAPNPGAHATASRTRALDAWTVIADWRDANAVRVRERCVYREHPRLVLERTTPVGTERLYLDERSALPVKLERREPHALWGDVLVEYLWTNWRWDGATRVPVAAYRLVDGEAEITRSFGPIATVPSDSTQRLVLPEAAPDMAPSTVSPPAPDTVRVSANTFLLVTRAYTNVVTLAHDTVWVLDAQTDERRARQDAAWIARLFPGRHPVALVVTDLAWSHISGVRYWVAHGATVYSHAASEAFLRRVTTRRWTVAPDSLEIIRRTRRAAVTMRFRPVNDSLPIGGGAIRLHHIAGLGSEGALMAWIPADGFLYAGDFVQDTRAPSSYAQETYAATVRAGITPRRVAAMHVGLTPWSTIEGLVARH